MAGESRTKRSNGLVSALETAPLHANADRKGQLFAGSPPELAQNFRLNFPLPTLAL